MQGLADGYFVIPYTLGALPRRHAAAGGHDRPRRVHARPRPRSQERIDALLRRARAPKTPRELHRELGAAAVGRRRHGAQRGRPDDARSREIPQLRDEFWQNVSVPGDAEQPEQEPRIRRPRRRLPRVRRAAGARRAAPRRSRAAATSARRARRPTARRCATTSSFSYVGGLGVHGRRQAAGAAQGAADVRVREADAAELQVSCSCSCQSDGES